MSAFDDVKEILDKPFRIYGYQSMAMKSDGSEVTFNGVKFVSEVKTHGRVVGTISSVTFHLPKNEEIFEIGKSAPVEKIEKEENTYNPDYASPPGATIEDLMGEKRWSASLLGGKLGLGETAIHKLIKGRMKITSDLADKLGEVFGTDSLFWKNREKQYRERQERLMREKNAEKVRKTAR